MPSAPTCPAEFALALAEVRRLLGLSQVEVAGQMGVSQAQVARCESRGDMYLTTLRRYIEALGGELELVAHFPEHSSRLRLGGEDSKQRPQNTSFNATQQSSGSILC